MNRRILNHRVAVYVPSTIGNMAAPPSVIGPVRQWVQERFMREFGGFTGHYGNGGYIDGTGTVVTESVYVVYAWTEVSDKRTLAALADIALGIAAAMRQESVAVEFDNTLSLLSWSELDVRQSKLQNEKRAEGSSHERNGDRGVFAGPVPMS